MHGRRKGFADANGPLCSLSSSLRGSPWLSAAHHRRVAVWNRFLSSCSFCGVLETKEFVTNLPPPGPPESVPFPPDLGRARARVHRNSERAPVALGIAHVC